MSRYKLLFIYFQTIILMPVFFSHGFSTPIFCGVSKVNITKITPDVYVPDSLYSRTMVLEDSEKRLVIITMDVVALERIGPLPKDFLQEVKRRVESEFGIPRDHIIINTSHCHGVTCEDVIEKTVLSVKKAIEDLTPVKIGAAKTYEFGVSINRRLNLQNGHVRDERRAYSLPWNSEVESVNAIDPEIGLLCVKKMDGTLKSILFNFACHPIQGRDGSVNTADFPGYVVTMLENILNPEIVPMFTQGCGGDINPLFYKEMQGVRNYEYMGLKLGRRILTSLRTVEYSENNSYSFQKDSVLLPLANLSETIDSLETLREKILESLSGNSLNLESYVNLFVEQALDKEYPSQYVHYFLNEEQNGTAGLRLKNLRNKELVKGYRENIRKLEELTVIKENLRLLKNHQKSYESTDKKYIWCEINIVKLGDFVWITFPGELSSEIGMNIKKDSPYSYTFVSGYTNGYIYYCPTDQQLKNRGGAQEDSESILDVGWQSIFENKVKSMLSSL